MTEFKKSFWHKTVDANTVLCKEIFPADFHESEINSVDFSGIDLSKSTFAHAVIKDCNFSNCDLTGVSFFGASLSNCNFTGAKICSSNGIPSNKTVFPEDLSTCAFDEKGIKALSELDKIAADSAKRAKDWMDRHPIRNSWTPGSKLDSPWEGLQ